MPRHLLEQLSGVGTIYAGRHLLRTGAYRLSVWSEADTAPEPVPTGATIDGFIDITGIAEAVVLAGPEALTLVLEDGRTLPFALVGTSGRIVGRGGLRGSSDLL